jgi:hypothetical protein
VGDFNGQLFTIVLTFHLDSIVMKSSIPHPCQYSHKLPKVTRNAINPYHVHLDSHRTITNHIGGVMVSVLALSAVDRGIEPQSGQTKDYKMVFAASPLSTQY